MGAFRDDRPIREAKAPGSVALAVLAQEALRLPKENCYGPRHAEDDGRDSLSGYHSPFLGSGYCQSMKLFQRRWVSPMLAAKPAVA